MYKLVAVTPSKSTSLCTLQCEQRKICIFIKKKYDTGKSEGRKYLGGYIGSEDGWDEYADELVNSWCGQLMVLSKIAKTEPQAAYAAFVSGFKHKLTYYIRTMPNIKQHLTRLDAVVDNVIHPSNYRWSPMHH